MDSERRKNNHTERYEDDLGSNHSHRSGVSGDGALLMMLIIMWWWGWDEEAAIFMRQATVESGCRIQQELA